MQHKVKLCAECAYGTKQDKYNWKMHCQHPQVNAKDVFALASAQFVGSDTIDERRKTSWFAACGQRGKLWTPK
jgi:hypothetical protein